MVSVSRRVCSRERRLKRVAHAVVDPWRVAVVFELDPRALDVVRRRLAIEMKENATEGRPDVRQPGLMRGLVAGVVGDADNAVIVNGDKVGMARLAGPRAFDPGGVAERLVQGVAHAVVDPRCHTVVLELGPWAPDAIGRRCAMEVEEDAAEGRVDARYPIFLCSLVGVVTRDADGAIVVDSDKVWAIGRWGILDVPRLR